MKIRLAAAVAISVVTATWSAFCYGEPIPIKDFARRPDIGSVAISPDGRYISMIKTVEGIPLLAVIDRPAKGPINGIMAGDKKRVFQMNWCEWANATRLVCGYRAMDIEGDVVFPVTRMVAVNADGSEQKVLLQNSKVGGSQLQDRVLDWTPSEPKSVLIQADDNGDALPSVFELDIYSGAMGVRVRERNPLMRYVSDGNGNIRLAYGIDKDERSFYARLSDDRSWVQLAKFKAFSKDSHFSPLGVIPGTNKVYATGSHEGRTALWEMDLTDQENPKLIFSHPQVDAEDPIIASDGRLLGIYYETDRPFVFYIDDLSRSILEAVKPMLPAGNFNSISYRTADNQFFIIRSSSDIEAGTYYFFGLKDRALSALGTEYPELSKRKSELGRMQSIHYTAKDGTEIPGYLTVPVDKRAEKLPLIVMPHGGPIARDTWSFDWVAQFLASRGYAVLQMNFRGSSGYGDDWFWAAHQDWGGLTYSDIADGTRWAIEKGIANPKRICTVGWSFGGYAALLGAVRDSQLYQCAVSIAGVSDLQQLEVDERDFIGGQAAREQIGKDKAKLKQDSPALHAEDISIPLLLIHGDRDFQVRVEHSRDMAKALKRAKKPYKYLELEQADHQLSRESDRITLLTELDAFLKTHLGKN